MRDERPELGTLICGGDGPRIGAVTTVLFCFWLAWSRFRVIISLLDKSQPSVFAAVDVALRRCGGARLTCSPTTRRR
jgi:hypothetical protein